MTSYHNIESRKGRTGAAAHPYMGWSKRRGTVYYIEKISATSWRAAPSLALHNDEPPYFYGQSLRDISERLEQI